MNLRLAVPLLAVLLAAAPVVQAGPQPALYFLKDGATGPVGDGLLNITIPNGTEPQVRPVFPGQEAVMPVRFSTDANEAHPGRILGPLFIGLWTGQSAIVNGNLSATLYELTADAAIPLATGSVSLDANASEAPDPMSLVPPDPSDPEGSALYLASQVLPLVLQPPTLLYLGNVDLAFNQSSRFAIGFALEAGSSPLPLPVGAFATIQYDSILSPTFVYAPWHMPDPPAKPKPTTTQPAASTPPSASPSEGVVYREEKDSPGAGLLLLSGSLAAVALALRRRIR